MQQVKMPEGMTTWQMAPSFDGGLEAYAERWGKDKAADLASDCMAGMVLGRRFGESFEQYLEREPKTAKRLERCKKYLESLKNEK